MDQRPANALGDFLRGQRARVSPREAGLPSVGDRRVAGLRREEVAVLAGVSADYYTRLEQGRERSPSAQVVDALCTALRLGADARAHAFRLAGLAPSTPGAVENVSPELRQMMDAFPHAAAYITNPAFRVLAANPTAAALIAPIQGPEGILGSIFLSPAARDYYVNWDDVAQAAVHALRLSAGFVPQHPEVTDLVTLLHAESDAFRRIWDDHTVSGLALTRKTIRHPLVGVMDLNYQTFDIRSAPGQQLTAVTAQAGSDGAERLALLATASTRRAEHV
ncbi:helix-turn-helix transcriptional regulator [Winogradskya consettensis]|uniref:Transcriptional regulator n=1 Tax=Winogradskya consettensis TaxID=113560 RepID=A0A919VRL0_9ACTN|nr:helix-turn-helix transcriptional regulator [Actinoplanes consettensis]GIM76164.1 transcriptional regulator [Actinoplanes consettensis]